MKGVEIMQEEVRGCGCDNNGGFLSNLFGSGIDIPLFYFMYSLLVICTKS